jgi:hypothetical protein
MPPHSSPPDAPPGLELPTFSDRLPDLTQALRQAGRDLSESKPAQSYIPCFEDIYAVSHTLKGVTRILACPKPMEDFIIDLNATLVRALSGTAICRRHEDAGKTLREMADLLDRERPAETADTAALAAGLAALSASYSEDVAHDARIAEIPPHLFYVNEFVSKKSREITLLKLNHTVVEDEALLDDIPLWRTQLNEALVFGEWGRGLVVNFLPFLSPEGSRSLKLWAWVAAGSHSRASLKQRIKDILPRASLAKI